MLTVVVRISLGAEESETKTVAPKLNGTGVARGDCVGEADAGAVMVGARSELTLKVSISIKLVVAELFTFKPTFTGVDLRGLLYVRVAKAAFTLARVSVNVSKPVPLPPKPAGEVVTLKLPEGTFTVTISGSVPV